MMLAIAIKIVLALGTVIGAFKFINEMLTNSKARLREEYRFAKEFLADMDDEECALHPVAIERGYYAIAGTNSVTVTEIKYLLDLTSPDRKLRDYVSSRKYVEVNSEGSRIGFREKYKSMLSRRWRKIVYLLGYVASALIAVSPLILAAPLHFGPKFMMLTIITVPCFGFYAVDALRSLTRILTAERLVNEQQKHTPVILLDKTTRTQETSLKAPIKIKRS